MSEESTESSLHGRQPSQLLLELSDEQLLSATSSIPDIASALVQLAQRVQRVIEETYRDGALLEKLWAALPPEVLLIILDNLDIRGLCALACTSKAGQQIINVYAASDRIVQWILTTPLVQPFEHCPSRTWGIGPPHIFAPYTRRPLQTIDPMTGLPVYRTSCDAYVDMLFRTKRTHNFVQDPTIVASDFDIEAEQQWIELAKWQRYTDAFFSKKEFKLRSPRVIVQALVLPSDQINFPWRGLNRLYEVLLPGIRVAEAAKTKQVSDGMLANYTHLEWRVLLRQVTTEEMFLLEPRELQSIIPLIYQTNQQDLDSITPLYRAAQDGDLTSVQALIEGGHDVNERNLLGGRPLDIAVRHNHPNIVRALIKAGAVIERKTSFSSDTVTDVALQHNYMDILELLAQGLDFTNSFYAKTVLHSAARMNHVEAIDILLQAGADVNAQASGTPLHTAAHYNCVEAVSTLLTQPGIDVNATNQHGHSALHTAITEGSSNELILQLIRNPNIIINTHIGTRPLLHAAVYYRYSEEVISALCSKVDVNLRNEEGKSALHVAARFNNAIMISRLAKQTGIQVNGRDYRTRTPLHEAINAGSSRSVEALLSLPEVDPTIPAPLPNKYYSLITVFKIPTESPLRSAKRTKNADIITQLEQACGYRPQFSPLKVTGLVLGSMLVAAGIGAAFTGLAPAALTAFFVAHMSVKLATFVTASLFAALGGFSTLATALTAITTHKTCYQFNPSMPVFSILASEYLCDKRVFSEGSANTEDSETHVMTIGDEATETAALH